MAKTYHIKMTHRGNKPAILDNSESALCAGFSDPIEVLNMWQKDAWEYYTSKFEGLDRETLNQKCLQTLRDQYDKHIRNYKPTTDNVGSVCVLTTVHGYDIAIHYNVMTLNQKL